MSERVKVSNARVVGNHLTRRDLVAKAAAAAATAAHLTSCAIKSKVAPAQVSILRCESYGGPGLYETVRRLLSLHKLDVKGKRVVLKPNLVEFDPGSTINTHPALVHATLEAFRSLGAAHVGIAEGPGHRRLTMDLADEAGYFRTIPRFEEIFTDLNLDRTSEVKLRQPSSTLRSLHLPATALGADLLVSMPKLKTHHWVGATLSMKNLFGLAPGGVYGWPKNVLHWAGINECIADLYRVFSPKTFAIVDGIDGMEGNGPIQGTPKHAGVLIAGADMAAVDATCCRIMGIDPERIEYLNLAVRRAALAESAIMQTGEKISTVQTNFQLLPQFEAAIRLKRTA